MCSNTQLYFLIYVKWGSPILFSWAIKSYYDHSFVFVNTIFVIVLAFIQGFLLIFNSGDCTSNSNRIDTNFIQRIFVTAFDCKDYSIKPWIPQEIILGFYCLNLAILTVFIVKTLASAHPKSI